jgi:hypothetical protein
MTTHAGDGPGENPGLIEIFPARAVRIRDQYDRRLADAHSRVDVLGFGLRSFREDYGARIVELAQRARVRLLLLDPTFPDTAPYALQRDQEERNPAGSISRDVREFLIQVLPRTADPSAGIQLRLYRALPMVNIFRVDDEMFWGPYLIGDQSRNAPTLLVRSGGYLFARLLAHFELLWTSEWSISPAEANLD